MTICIVLFSGTMLPVYAEASQPVDPFEIKEEFFKTDQDSQNDPDEQAGEQPSDTPKPKLEEVKPRPFNITARSVYEKVAPGQSFIVEVIFDIAPGHQLYAKETSVTALPSQGLRFGSAKPVTPALEKLDPYRGKIPIYKKNARFELPVTVEKSAELGTKSILLTVAYLGCTETVCFLPEKAHLDLSVTVVSEAEALASQAPRPPASDMTSVEENPFRKMADRFGPLGVLVAAFIWGFLASLTPCVYPMIPVTVSIIGAGSAGSTSRGFLLSVFYVLGMSLTYAVFGVIAAWSGSLFGEYTNHPAIRIVVSAVFVILALSMFDLFYIQMPSSVSSKLGGRKSIGIFGVFLTGAAAGALVGPCVGPMLVAMLVYIAALGSKVLGFLIMWNFALGMGMLFLVIGTFSGAATSLPKAGEWMEKLKRIFGVLLLAAALYYIEPLLPGAVFMLITGAFFIGIGVFSGAFDALRPESTGKDRLWKAAGIVFLVLGICYVAKFAVEDEGDAVRQNIPEIGIQWMTDEASALARAGAEKKPVIMDFSAEWCAACKKLERETFTDPAIIAASGRFVCVRIDCTNTADPIVRDMQKKYNIIGLPTILFLNSEGQIDPNQSVTEFVRPAGLLERMNNIR
ncbi:MAG: hypothetical protein BWK80_39490 [Desulfobacteraceae bacterium IS3]|nr:MAG: hypothetical protein BWK80_39490 [Desulfobacteraceae bacterium IS3]